MALDLVAHLEECLGMIALIDCGIPGDEAVLLVIDREMAPGSVRSVSRRI